MRKKLHDTEYEIDEFGNVYTWLGMKMKPTINKHGFNSFNIRTKDGRQKYILPHIEVYLWMIGPYPLGGIKHINGNKLDNYWGNLTAAHPIDEYIDWISRGVSVTKVAAHYKTSKKEISKYVSMYHSGGIRDLRKHFPLNKSLDVQ